MPKFKEGEQSPRVLFIERMKREGRGKEWYENLRTLQKETGKRFSQASYVVMRQMGYISPAEERRIDKEYKASLHMTSLERAVDKVKEEVREERRVENFEEAVRLLPDKATVDEEIDWIRAHPAMARKARSKNNLDPVMVTAEDILFAPQGRAPSKAAVYALQHWANHPVDFFKQLLGEQKKVTSGGEGRKVDTDEDISEIERLLAGVKAAIAGDTNVKPPPPLEDEAEQ